MELTATAGLVPASEAFSYPLPGAAFEAALFAADDDLSCLPSLTTPSPLRGMDLSGLQRQPSCLLPQPPTLPVVITPESPSNLDLAVHLTGTGLASPQRPRRNKRKAVDYAEFVSSDDEDEGEDQGSTSAASTRSTLVRMTPFEGADDDDDYDERVPAPKADKRKRKRVTKAEQEAKMKADLDRVEARKRELEDVINEARTELSTLRPLIAFILKKEGHL